MSFDTLASAEAITAAEKALAEHGFLPEAVATGADALARIKELIPAGVSIMNGTSRTLQEIGYVEYLKAGEHGWNNLHAAILAETDPAKQAELRAQSVNSEYYVGSVHALTETGELLIASNSGSQLPHLVYTSKNLVLVVSTKKIVKDLAEAERRVREHVFDLEDARMKEVGMGGSYITYLLSIFRDPPFMNRKVHILLVNEDLGF